MIKKKFESFYCSTVVGVTITWVTDDKTGVEKPLWRLLEAGSFSVAEQQVRTHFRSQLWPSEESAAVPGK